MTRRRDRLGDAPLLAWGEALRSAKQRRRRRIRHGVAIAVACALPLGSTLFHPAPRLLWNASASAPIGLYEVSPGAPIAPGDMVIAHVPARFRHLAALRRYVPMNVPLVKQVVAYAGDDVCAIGHRIVINGRPVADRRAIDGSKRPMPMWSGCIRLRGRQLFLLMPDHASFDGRYFGVTEDGDVIGKATLLWRR